MGGGALVLPIIHDITQVSMNTLRIEVRRAGEKSPLITRNRMRIEVIVEFFIISAFYADGRLNEANRVADARK